ncbi:M10 family metallopeptidase [Pseudomonas cucumis]|uniref:M10 family metallopeptidase n=1 Tax=Pseudomonas cucumis TaxID=2954082 RepID=A0ABY9ETZ0_9PSED|nr:M10 family metallopeptidase [Pseudomonas cucumis]WLG83973.1 M10 family metallopeptidase [Pseudomonas cucumis]
MPTPLTYSFSFPSSLTGVTAVDSIISGTYWLGSNWTPTGPTNLSYSFMAPITSYFITDYSADNEYNALYALTAAQQSAITSALSTWSAVANINFTLTSDNITNVGDLRFGGYRLMDNETAAWAYSPANSPTGGDVWIGTETNNPNPVKGTYDYLTFVHEIGHALGLKHPFSASATNATVLDASLDDVFYTVMSYNDSYSYQPTTPMLLDILAIQSLYGANNLWQTGNNTYSWASDQSVFETIWDAGGNDTLDGSNQLQAVRLNLNEGTFSTIGKAFVELTNQTAVNGLAIAFGAKIENATGSTFDDTLIGNALDNTLNGLAGADTMTGGDGVDTYYVDNVGDVVIETDASLTALDRVFSSIDYTLGANVENLILIGNAINGTGNAASNRITGNTGANTLDGSLGADTMIGGDGVDTYYVDNVGDVVIETDASLTALDRVFSSIDYTLGANVENLILIGNANLNGTGSAVNNRMTGNDGANLLDGGLGADTLIGGLGNDTYIVDNLGDTLTETSTLLGEIDTVRASVNWTLGSNLENLVLTGSDSLNATGNTLSNALTGNTGNNILDGGAGTDTLIGGLGNDTYIVDNLGDTLTETSTLVGEIDTVRASVSWTLGSNLENLVLTGSDSLNATGNTLNNVLTGNTGNNTLSGGAGDDTLDGGAGADTLIGGDGVDTYYVDNVSDVVTETDASLTALDRVFSTIDYTLGANVENLILIGNAINGTGNAANNRMTGNTGANTLDGSLGADTMIGGDGVDTYYVDNVGDVVIETDASLTALDRVFSSIDYTLGANVENLILIGNANLNGTGSAVNNRMTGNDGANLLDGGLGADTLIGGLGNDTYIVDNLGDTLTETSTLLGEIDTVRSSVDWTLGANLENLVLSGNAINGTGNELNNSLTGNTGANTLVGGIGADIMTGGDGVDTYYVDNVGDAVIETDASLTALDRVFSSIDYTLGANVENLILIGNANLNGTGSAVNNRMTGNDGANLLDGGLGADTLIGGLGNDTYIVDNLGDTLTETSTLLGEIDTVRASVNWTLGSNLENLVLTGSDSLNATGNTLNNVLTGNTGNNTLSGGAGDDTLDGGAGADTLIGGDGVDTYYVDNVGDVVIETDTSLTALDRVFSSIDYTLGTNVENLILIGNANLNGTGSAVNNRMTGNDGANLLDGGLGADTLIGGLGNDTYIVDNLGDTLTETSTLLGEIDTVRSSVDWTLGANLENLVLSGNAINGTGNELNNSLTGNTGANTLVGGIGADIMTGGDGVDTYYVDNVGDAVIETDASLTALDRVFSSIDYTLGANVENLILIGNANLNGTGSAVNNRMTGNDGANILDGGLGTDTLIGGLGNDTYIVDNLGDTLTETSTLLGEIDTVRASVNWTLGSNLENLVLTGSDSLNATGNTLNNVLTGNTGNNTLSGGAGDDTLDGGAGADTLIGGDGVDTYYVDNVGDVVIETDTSLTALDRVFSSIDYTLGANVENLILIGNANLNGTGSAVNNRMTGNDGANLLDGGLGADTLIGGLGNDTLIGGLGADTLTGGDGADTFVFNAWNETGIGNLRDVITDFSSLQGDKVDLTQFDANLLSAGVNGFTFIGANDFTGAGQLRFIDQVLSGNVSGNTGADFEIQLIGVNSFSANELVA